MDDSRIDEIRRTVLSRLGGSAEERAGGTLEARVAALESAVATLQRGGPAVVQVAAAPRGHTHPSLVVLSLPSDADVGGAEPGRCVMEPDKPCVHSGACRTFGH